MSANKHTNKLKLQNYAYEVSDNGVFIHPKETSNVWFQPFTYDNIAHAYYPIPGHGDYPFIEASDIDWRPYKIDGHNVVTSYDLIHSMETMSSTYWVAGEGTSSIVRVIDQHMGTAEGDYAISEGVQTEASGEAAHAEGEFTQATNRAEHTEGCYNKSNKASDTFGDAGNTISSIGIGTNTSNRKNAVEVMQNGDMYVIGVGDYDGTNFTTASTLQESLASSTAYAATKVDQIIATGNASYRLLFKYSPNDNPENSYTYYADSIWYNPSLDALTNKGGAYFATNSGAVGIGLQNPYKKFDVKGQSYFWDTVYIDANRIGFKPHIDLNRVGYNYVNLPSNDGTYFAVSFGSVSHTNAKFAVSKTAVFPGRNNNIVDLGTQENYWKNSYVTKYHTPSYEISETSGGRLAIGTHSQKAAAPVNVGNLLVSNDRADYTKVPSMGAYIKGQIRSGIQTGTAPFVVDSTTKVDKLNADYLDGEHSHNIRAYPKNASDVIFSVYPYINANVNIFSKTTTIDIAPGDAPFAKCFGPITDYVTFSSDYIPVTPGDVIFGETWAYRPDGATGTNDGVLYCGMARFDRNKKPIATNSGLSWFVTSNETVPSDGLWHKYSKATTIPTTHTPYNGSDGGGVYFIKVYLYVNYNKDSSPETYIGGLNFYRANPLNDSRYVNVTGDTMTGALKRYYSAASNDPMISLTSNGKNAYLFAISDGTSVQTSMSWGFGLKYLGANSGNNNSLMLYAANQNATAPVKAFEVKQSGETVSYSYSYFLKTVNLWPSIYEDTNATGALNLNNSDIYNVNSIKFADASGGPAEGLQWKRSSGSNIDSIWVLDGEAYITPNRAWKGQGTNYKFLHEGNLKNHQFTNSAYGVLLSYATPTKTSTQLELRKENTWGRYYGVVATTNGYAYVNVPWKDANIGNLEGQSTDYGYMVSFSYSFFNGNSTSSSTLQTTILKPTNTAYGVIRSAAAVTKSSGQLSTQTTNIPGRYYGVSITTDGIAYTDVPWMNDSVTQKISSADTTYNLLLKNASGSTDQTAYVNYSSNIFYNPSKQALTNNGPTYLAKMTGLVEVGSELNNMNSKLYTYGDTFTSGTTYVKGGDAYLGSGTNAQCHLKYDNSTKCIKFIFD